MKSRDLKQAYILMVLFALVILAQAQTNEPPSHIPTPQQPNSPFGTEWAKPPGTGGSYIYNDPRLRDPYSSRPARRNTRCPAPLLFDPASGTCR